MKKAVYYGIGDVRVEDVPMPDLPEQGLLVKVKYCGVCGSDIHEYKHGPSTGIFAPGVWGHEFSGQVIEAAPGVEDFRPGDRVIGKSITGAYAEYVSGHAKAFHKMDVRMSYETGAVAEPATVACYAVKKGAVEPGESALVVGAGPIGLLITMALKVAGAKPIYVSEMVPKRKSLALEAGADGVFDPSQDNVVEEVKKRTKGRGADVSFECVGLEPALFECINATRRHKRVIIVGSFVNKVSLDFYELLQKDISLTLSLGADFDATMPLLAEGKIPADRIITRIMSLEEFAADGIRKLAGGAKDEVKVLVNPEL